MNKKGTGLSTILTYILLIALLIVVLASFLIGPKAILNGLAKGANLLADRYILGLMRTNSEKPELESDKSLEETYENIASILRSEGNGPCVFKYKPFSNEIANFKIKLSKSEEEQGIFIELENKKKEVVKHNIISGKLPCVVGEGQAAQNFYNNYLGKSPCKDNCPQDYTITNIIFYNGDIYVSGSKRSLDDRNLAFKTRDGNVCFFPTYSGVFTSFGCDVSAEGLDDDCMKIIEQNMKVCGGAEYKESFYQGTYYGKLDEWKIINPPFSSGTYYYYTGTDLRVPYMFRIEAKDLSFGRKGLTETELKNIFSSESGILPNKQGIYFDKVYYDTKDKWKYNEGNFKESLIECNKCWVYVGDDSDVPKRFKTDGILMEEKVRLFGPPFEEQGG